MGEGSGLAHAPPSVVSTAAAILAHVTPWPDATTDLLAAFAASGKCSAATLRVPACGGDEPPDTTFLASGSWSWGSASGSDQITQVPIVVNGTDRGSLRVCVPEATDAQAVTKDLVAIAAILSIAIARDECGGKAQGPGGLYESHIAEIPAITYIETHDPKEPSGLGELFVSSQVEEMLGYTPEEWLADGGHWQRAIHPDDLQRISDETDRTSATGDPFCAEYRVITAGGEWKWLRDESRLVRNDAGEPMYWHGVITDVTHRKEAEEQVTFLAYHDALTGLANRPRLEEVADGAIARARRQGTAVAAMYLDLDDFKSINDGLGHDVGDALLRTVAERFTTVTRDTDLVSRLGGDEFLILLPDLPIEADAGPDAGDLVNLMAARIHDVLAEPIVIGGRIVSIATSVGTAIYPMEASDLGGLMRVADQAMYARKRSHAVAVG